MWVNADGGSAQIQSFDAYTGAACGKGAGGYSGSGPIVPVGGGSQSPDGGDAGTDGGSDAGTDAGFPDGGCAGFNARPIDNATDYCNGVPSSGPPTTVGA